jgi:hypothetical protein
MGYVKLNFSWHVSVALLALGLTSALGQASPQLVCDSVAASKSKSIGGTIWGDNSSGYYLSAITECSQPPPNCPIECPPGTMPFNSWTKDWWIGIGNNLLALDDVLMATPDSQRRYFLDLNVDCFGSGPAYPCTIHQSIDPVTYEVTTTGAPFSCVEFACYSHFVFSNEYTTDMLKANTTNALPPYPGTFTGTCSAYRNLSPDEASYTIQRFRYKFTFPAAEQAFVVHWVERFTPEGGGPPADTSRSESIPAGATESSVREVLEPSSNGTITIECFGILEVESASIRDGQFVITVPALDCSASTGTLDLIVKRQASSDQIVLKTFQNQPPGTITIRLDDVMNVGVTPLDGQDGIVFDRAAVRWRVGAVDETSADRNFDVPVEVLSQRTISNYFSPTWDGNWGGSNSRKGVYPAGQFPAGLYNAQVRTQLLDALDPINEGLAMNGNTVIRAQVQPAYRNYPQYIFLNGTDRGYIEFPDRDQRNTASGSTVQFLRSTSVAVRPDADRLNYRTADQVYVPAFGVRTVDDAGSLHGNTHQIDVWIGQGDSALKAQADAFGIQSRTCLKLLNP